MRRRTRVAVAAILLAGLAVGAVAAMSGAEHRSRPVGGPRRPTAVVVRRDLIARDSFDGTLEYADARALMSGIGGTVTWLAPEGSAVRRAERLYRVDTTPVRLLYGDVPAWRSMSDGTEGRDILQLERNLAVLGFTDSGDMDVDGDFDDDTKQALVDWQEAVGSEDDGVADLGEIVFLPGPRRVGSHVTALGAPIAAGAQVMETTSTEQVVSLDLQASRQELARRGATVQVELPDGRTVPGRITDVGDVAERDPEDEDADPTIEITVALRGRPLRLDQAPVDVSLATEVARAVLAVPVEALLALAEGGYAVEVEDGAGARLVAVETGLYADGYVEVAGQGLTEGTRVVVAE